MSLDHPTPTPTTVAEGSEKMRLYVRRVIARIGPLKTLVDIDDVVGSAVSFAWLDAPHEDEDETVLIDKAIAIVREESGRVFDLLGLQRPELGPRH